MMFATAPVSTPFYSIHTAQTSPTKAPKLNRARSAFMIFAEKSRAQTQAANPTVHYSELGRILGDKWLLLSSEEKQIYELQAQQERERYLSSTF